MTTPGEGKGAAASDFIDARIVKLVLSGLIVVSLIPDPGLEAALRPWLVSVFGVELAARIALAARTAGRRSPRELAFLVVDALALASFLPAGALHAPIDLAWLRVLRIFRLVSLLRHAEELMASVYRAVTHREQLAQFWLVTAAVLSASFASAVVLTELSVPYDGAAAAPGAAGFVDRMWWAFRQLESPDNIVQSLSVHPLLATMSIGLTIFGVFLISYVIGIGANVVDQVVRAERRRPVAFGGHTVVLGPTEGSESLVRELVRLHGKNRRLVREWPKGLFRWLLQSKPVAGRPVVPRVAVLGESDSPPAYLFEPGMGRVTYREGEGSDPAALARVAAFCARRALVLRDPRAGADADAINLARLSALRAMSPHAHVFVEVEREDHAAVVRAVGGEGTYVLDVPKFLGLFLCQHLVVPGLAPMLRELLGADGSEIYTHVFTGPRPRPPGGQGATVSFAALAAHANEAHGVTLVGVLLGDAPREPNPLGLVGADGLVVWVNPTDHVPPSCHALGARRGEVPLATLRGFIGISNNYFPIRDFAEAFERGLSLGARRARPPGLAVARKLVSGLAPRRAALRRVLVVGYGPALPWLVRGLARFVPGVEVRIVLAVSSGEEAKLGRWLDALRHGLEAPELAPEGPLTIQGGGTVTVALYEGPDRTGFVEDAIGERGADALVFLADAEAPDPDARVALQALKLVRAAAHAGRLAGRHVHLLVELDAAHRGDSLRRELALVAGAGVDLEVTRVSTEEIKSYFMVQGALVPGLIELYESLVGAPGQELVRLPVDSADRTEVAFGAIRDALADRRCLPIALELANGALVSNPPHDLRVRPAELAAVFAIAETEAMAERRVVVATSAA